MSLKSVLGLDVIEVGIQAVITGVLILVAQEVNTPRDGFIISSMIGVASLVVFGVRRKLALRGRGPAGLTTGEMAAERLADLEERLSELDAVQARVAELEERLDFAERLLADANAPLKAVGPGDPR